MEENQKEWEEIKNQEFQEIDITGLANELAQQQFNQQTKDVPANEIWEITVTESGISGKDIAVGKSIRSHWGSIYWGLRDGYMKLIKSFAKELEDEDRN